jgi:SAM-dependent methyltransferase
MTNIRSGKVYDAEQYAQNYVSGYGFERYMTRARQNCCLRFIENSRPRTVLEVGCGPELLFGRTGDAGGALETWVTVEPSQTYGQHAAEAFADDRRFSLVPGYLEEAVEELRRHAPDGFDVVLLSGLVHETTEPEKLLLAARELLADQGVALVIVPNEQSMHRLLAVEMNLVKSAGEITKRNVELGQRIVYSPETLKDLLVRCGYVPVGFEGYMTKFLTNDQMQQVVELFGEAIVDGLEALGRRFPENAAEFGWIVRKA